MSRHNEPTDTDETVDGADGVDPVEFIRRALQISPEDARQVREDAAKRERGDAEGLDRSNPSG